MKHSEASQGLLSTLTHDANCVPRRWAPWCRRGGDMAVVRMVVEMVVVGMVVEMVVVAAVGRWRA